MKRLVDTCSLLMLGVMFLVSAGCFRQNQPGEERPPSEPEAGQRGFESLDLPRDREIVPAEYPVRAEIRLGRDATTGDGSSLDTLTRTRAWGRLSENVDEFTRQTYRIQIFTSKVFGDARWELTVAEEIFDRPVYLDYEVPYYKVRVGSFLTRDEAEEYAERVRASGYPDAWVVAVNFDTQGTQPLYLEPLDNLDNDSTRLDTAGETRDY